MTTTLTEQTVGELAAENPAATRVFEKLGIDYCCGGNRTLEDACAAKGLRLEEVQAALTKAADIAPAQDRDWNAEPLANLIAHIQDTHHQFTRAELARLAPLFDKVSGVHGKNHPELAQMRATFAGLAQELTSHMMKEEMVLFPYILRMEQAFAKQQPVPRPPFGSVQNPVAMMMHEHDGAGQALADLRAASHDYAAPADACISFRTLYQALASFEADLHQHIHLENNILFPRAIEIERTAC